MALKYVDTLRLANGQAATHAPGYFVVVNGCQYYLNLTFAKGSPIYDLIHGGASLAAAKNGSKLAVNEGDLWLPRIFLSWLSSSNVVQTKQFKNVFPSVAERVEAPCDGKELGIAIAVYNKKLEAKATVDTNGSLVSAAIASAATRLPCCEVKFMPPLDIVASISLFNTLAKQLKDQKDRHAVLKNYQDTLRQLEIR